MYITDFTFEAHNNFEQMLTLFSQIAQEANQIWYPGRPVNAHHRYQI